MRARTLLTAAALALPQFAFAVAPPPAGEYAIDPVHSKVGFEVAHLVISSVEGKFRDFSGLIKIGGKLEACSVEARIKTASIDTGVEARDNHLRSADFFDAAKFPEMTFTSRKVSWDGSTLTIVGDFTLHGVTKSVTLVGKYFGAINDPQMGERAAFEVSTKIDRRDFGLVWNKLIEVGPVVGNEVTISIKVEAVRKAPTPKA